jgi:ribosome-binding protein aMBF1 (putative translation factor)
MALLDNLLAEITPEEQARTDRKMRIAAIIDDAIKAKGWGKKQFAEKIGRKPSEITKWLSGTQNFTVDTLADIEQVLGIKLLNLTEKRKAQPIAVRSARMRA